MGSKKEVEIGDYVIYKQSGEVVCDRHGNPIKIVEFWEVHSYSAVRYEDGGFDYVERIEKASSLLLELL